MRTVYHEQLSDLDRQLAEMCALAVAVMKQATDWVAMGFEHASQLVEGEMPALLEQPDRQVDR
jgi:hypothetical protein